MKITVTDDNGVTTEFIPANGAASVSVSYEAGQQKAVVGEPSSEMVSVQGPVPATLADQVSIYETRGGSGVIQVNVSPEDKAIVTAAFGPAVGHNPSEATASINGVPIPTRQKILGGMVTLALNHSAPDAITLTTGANKVEIVGYQTGAESRVQFTRQP